jgi:hypothetical protein
MLHTIVIDIVLTCCWCAAGDLACCCPTGEVTTADPEEVAFLHQQHQLEVLEAFAAAKAAQGRLLRGALNTSLRGSREALWVQPQHQHQHQQRPGSPCMGVVNAGQTGGLNGVSRQLLQRPGTAPPGGCRGSTTAAAAATAGGGGRCGGALHQHSPTGRKQQQQQQQYACLSVHVSSPSAAAAGGGGGGALGACSPTSPLKCHSPGLLVAVSSSSNKRCSSPLHRSSGMAAAAAGGGGGSGRASPDRWAPVVTGFHQLPQPASDKAWQVANRLLVSQPPRDVMESLAGEWG